jgi:hypothetical protein
VSALPIDPAPTTTDQTGIDDLAAAIAHSADSSWSALRAFALRTRSPLARRALAQAADRSETDPYLRSQAAMLLALNPQATAADLDHARDLLGKPKLDFPDKRIWMSVRDAWVVVAQALLRASRESEVTEILRSVDLGTHHTWALKTDLVNPTRTGDRSPASMRRFLKAFNSLFVEDGLEPIQLERPDCDSDDDFVKLRAVPTETVEGDELVTVVMSAFKPSHELHTAVRSIRDQSWQAWELLIVDDDSGPEFGELLESVAATDDRIRLLHSPANRGTYAARNLAFTQAKGRYMTFQDSDDWSHPRRLERQVRLLQEQRRLVADRSWAVRAYPDLTLTYPGYPARRLNASSLLIDRPQVHQLLGDFDQVRMSADVEYPLRLVAAQPSSLADRPELGHLAITLLRDGSLSRADAIPGWMHWTRTTYKDAFQAWHKEIRAGRVPARTSSTAPRPFALPDARFFPDRTQEPAPAPDVVLFGDLRGVSPRAHATAELARLLSSTQCVGLAHAETPSPLYERRQPTHPAAQEQLNSALVSYAHMSRPDHIPLLVVTEPASLLHASTFATTVGSVLVLGRGWESSSMWTVQAVAARIAELWSIEPTWALADDEERRRFVAAHPDAPVWDAPLPWAIVPDRFEVARSRRTDGYRVVGNHASDGPDRWLVTKQELVAAFPPGDDKLDVRLLGGQTTVAKIFRREFLPPGWVDLRDAGTTVVEFLGQLDAFVYLGIWDDEAEVAVLEALAADLPVLLAPTATEVPLDLRKATRQHEPADISSVLLEAQGPWSDPGPALEARAAGWVAAVSSLLDRAPL